MSGAGSGSDEIDFIRYEAIDTSGEKNGTISPGDILEFGHASNVLVVSYTIKQLFEYSPSNKYHLDFVMSSPSQAKYLAVYVWVDDGATSLTYEESGRLIVQGSGLLYQAEPNTFSTDGGATNISVDFSPSSSGTRPLMVTVVNRNFGGSDTGYYGFGYNSCAIETVDRDENIITRITNNISGFFSELGDKITQWFNNLKSWFTELGDRISGFFTELGNKITGAFDALKNWFDEHIIQPVEEWWQGVLDWFEYNFTIPDGYFDTWRDSWEQWLSDHFGFLYDAGTLISDVFTSIMDVFSGESPNTLDIPEVKLPDILGGAVLIEAQTFDFDGFVDSIPALATIYGIYVTCMYGAALFAIIKLGQNTLEEILTDRQVTD